MDNMTSSTFSVQVRLASSKSDAVRVVRKDFKTADKRAAWLDEQDDKGLLVEVLGFAEEGK
jgi:hypothetical protein